MRSYKNADQRRLEILEASMNLFSTQGYQVTTMEQIAKQVKIARSSLYEYYKSKEDILFSLVSEVVEQERENPLEGTVREQLELLAAESIQRLQNHFALYKILFQELPTLSNPAAIKIKEWQGHSMNLVAHVIEAGLNEGVFKTSCTAEDIGFVFRALVGQRLADILISNEQVVPEKESKRLVALMWTGIGKD